MKTLAVFKNDERRAAVMVGADERRSSWCLDVIVRPRRDEEGENSFRHSMTILEGGVRLIPEYQVYLSGKRYAPSFLKNAKFALGLDPQLDIDRNEIMERLRHSPIADYPWSFRWTFPESPREGMVLGIAHNPLHRKWEPLPPFLQSLLDYVWRLFQIQRL